VDVIRSLAALALFSVSTPILTAAAIAATPGAAKADPSLCSTAPWWEKVTGTIACDGKSNSCRYETSLVPDAAKDCDVVGDGKSLGAGGGHGSAKDQFTRLTFERRFSPGAMPQDAALETGDTLIGRQVMHLAIDAAGKVRGCEVVSTSGDMTPAYGCADARAERFEASAVTGTGQARVGYMTVLVYGHEEHVV
jgi:hypothetical protein